MGVLQKILERQEVINAITLLITSALSYFVYLIRENQKKSTELAKGNKRSSLRNEYLQIFNCDKFTWSEKVQMTRVILEEYKALEGNHYIHGLDQIMIENALKEEKDETEQ